MTLSETTGALAKDSPAEKAKPWEMEFPYVLWRAQQTVHRRVQEALAEFGVTVTQLGLAYHLREQGRLSASDLARGHHLTPQSVGTALAQLEKIGWVERAPHPVHKRVILVSLTPVGEKGVKAGRKRISETADEITSSLSAGETDTVLSSLIRIVTALEGESLPTEALWPESIGRPVGA